MKKYFIPLAAVTLLAPLTSCLNDDNSADYKEWKEANDKFVIGKQLALTPDGNYEYETIHPDWAPTLFVLMKWHNDREATSTNLIPYDNSTVDVKYQVMLMDSTIMDSSYSKTDSVYSCQPCQNIPGFWTALTNMHVGDSVTVIVPWEAGYGSTGSGDIKPFSSLIFNIKLKKVTHFQTPS